MIEGTTELICTVNNIMVTPLTSEPELIVVETEITVWGRANFIFFNPWADEDDEVYYDAMWIDSKQQFVIQPSFLENIESMVLSALRHMEERESAARID